MSFPSAFGSQVAAIFDILSKAAVAEITKLAEEGALELRLEIHRKNSDIQELKASLEQLQSELCRAREDSALKDKQIEARNQLLRQQQQQQQQQQQDLAEDQATYLDQQTSTSFRVSEETGEVNGELVVKHEPTELSIAMGTATDSHNSTSAQDIHFDSVDQNEPIWPLPACSMFDKNNVAAQQLEHMHMQMFPPQMDQYAAHRNAENSLNSSLATAEGRADDPLNVPIKVEAEMQPVCMGGGTVNGVLNEQFGHVSSRQESQEESLNVTFRTNGQSVAPPTSSAHRSNSEVGHGFSKNNSRNKRLVSVWRGNQKLFLCTMCNRSFHRLSQLEEHKAVHQTQKAYRCLECGKSFTQKTRLKTHLRVHTGERPFSCHICGKMFSRQDNCLRHERFHSGLRPHGCPHCGKSFTSLGNLKIHQETHNQGR